MGRCDASSNAEVPGRPGLADQVDARLACTQEARSRRGLLHGHQRPDLVVLGPSASFNDPCKPSRWICCRSRDRPLILPGIYSYLLIAVTRKATVRWPFLRQDCSSLSKSHWRYSFE